jgi:hypothetical protein
MAAGWEDKRRRQKAEGRKQKAESSTESSDQRKQIERWHALAFENQTSAEVWSAYCFLPTAFCFLPTAFCFLPSAYCFLLSAF